MTKPVAAAEEVVKEKQSGSKRLKRTKDVEMAKEVHKSPSKKADTKMKTKTPEPEEETKGPAPQQVAAKATSKPSKATSPQKKQTLARKAVTN